MQGSNSKKNFQKQAEILCRTSTQKHFKQHEVESLLVIFYDALKDKCTAVKMLDRNEFRDILHKEFGMTEDILMDRVFREFDKDMDSHINTKEWVEGLSIFLRGTLEECIHYAFKVYDLNGDGYISREEMFQMLKHSLIKQPSEEDPDEGVKDLVELALKKMDSDRDSRLSFADFETAVKADTLLLQAFGPCLPDQKAIDSFDQMIKDAYL